MLGSVKIQNYWNVSAGVGVQLNTVTNGAGMSIKDFQTSIEHRSAERPRPAIEGNYDEYVVPGKRTFRIEGDIMDTTAALYWARRRALMAELAYQYTNRNKNYLVRLTLQDQGTLLYFPEDIWADCRLESPPEIPIGLAGATITPYLLQLKSNYPYMFGNFRSVVVNPNIGYVAVPNVLGNVPTPIEFRINGPITNPEIYLQDGAGYLSLFGVTITTGNYVLINSRHRTMYHTLGTNLYAVVEPAWHQLHFDPYGPTRNARLVGTGTSGATNLNVSWYNAYNI